VARVEREGMKDTLLNFDWVRAERVGYFVIVILLLLGSGYLLNGLIKNDLAHLTTAAEAQTGAIGRQSEILLKLDSSINRNSVLLETYLRK